MEYRNIIEELMDTKGKELLSTPFGAVMDLNQIRCINLDILAGHAKILTWRLWQEILSNDAVETLEVIEKWDVEENSHFLVLDKDQDDNMTGIFIDGNGMIEYTHYGHLIRNDDGWDMNRLKGNKLGNYYSSFNDVYFEDLMPDEIY